jgi:CheY-like chemotaxis protein
MNASPPLALVVDDDPLVLATLAMQLRRAGFSVVEAIDGEEALRCCERARPDIAVVDYRLPGFSGIQLIRRLHMPGVLLTGSDDPSTVAEACEAGAAAVLRKPVDTAHLPTLLREVLDARR